MSVSGTDSASARSFESMARDAGLKTLLASRHNERGVSYIQESSGLSAGLWRLPGGLILGVCGEGVGTKGALIEELVAWLKGDPWPGCDPYTYYYNIARCGVAMIVNDLITVGVMPMGILQILALFGSDWHKNEVRMQAVIDGWTDGCIDARVHWSGGETAELNIVLAPHTIVAVAGWLVVAKRRKKREKQLIRQL